jgi:hypothetical protein
LCCRVEWRFWWCSQWCVLLSDDSRWCRYGFGCSRFRFQPSCRVRRYRGWKAEARARRPPHCVEVNRPRKRWKLRLRTVDMCNVKATCGMDERTGVFLSLRIYGETAADRIGVSQSRRRRAECACCWTFVLESSDSRLHGDSRKSNGRSLGRGVYLLFSFRVFRFNRLLLTYDKWCSYDLWRRKSRTGCISWKLASLEREIWMLADESEIGTFAFDRMIRGAAWG